MKAHEGSQTNTLFCWACPRSKRSKVSSSLAPLPITVGRQRTTLWWPGPPPVIVKAGEVTGGDFIVKICLQQDGPLVLVCLAHLEQGAVEDLSSEEGAFGFTSILLGSHRPRDSLPEPVGGVTPNFFSHNLFQTKSRGKVCPLHRGHKTRTTQSHPKCLHCSAAENSLDFLSPVHDDHHSESGASSFSYACAHCRNTPSRDDSVHCLRKHTQDPNRMQLQ